MGTILNQSWNVGNYAGTSNNAYTFRLEIIENSQDVVNNKTNITVNKYLKGINGWSWYGYNSTDAFSGSVTDSITYNPASMTTGTEYLIHSYTADIAHNSDGTMSISVTNTFTPTGAYSSMPKSNSNTFTVALTTIPRASVLSLNKTSVNLNTTSGNAISYTITPYASSFTHKIIWSLGGGGGTITNATNGSLTYTQLLNALSSSANGTLSITLETYSGSTKIGSNSASVPVSVDLTVFKPTLSVGNIVVNTTPVTAATIKTYLIAGITTAKFTSTTSKPTGAASVTTTFTTSHSTLSASSTTSTSQQTITTGTLPSSETNNYTLTITVKATDSRGASVTVTKTATVYAYKKPIVTLQAYRVADSTSTTRDDGGSWVYVTFTSALGATVNGQNSIQGTICIYSGSISGTAANGAHIALTDSQNATFTVVATDKVSSSGLSVYVPTAAYPLDLYYNEGTNGIEVGVGLGGIASPGYISPYLPFDKQIKTSFNQSVAMGSLEGTSTTIPDLVNELRFSSGCMGSANIQTAYTNGGITIPIGWYNFVYSPHRSGGINGQASGDNCNYGNLILMGMNVDVGMFRIRVSFGSIASLGELLVRGNNWDALWTGSLTGTNSVTFTYSSYSAYCIVGTPAKYDGSSLDSGFSSVIIPRAKITTSDVQWQMGSGTMFFGFKIKYSGTTVTLTKHLGGPITAVYGIK